ncbi:hypothetical protein EVAR_11015_1 [Eumeta japonica]|uniref:Uncharacterized protein n=1 Tax=Eumeta variegata TaxID=151549 RepID=A0A4C1YLC3_EUMVA|nr:hypothetical protein EVAR_11015_1 [Eumeta japonica]
MSKASNKTRLRCSFAVRVRAAYTIAAEVACKRPARQSAKGERSCAGRVTRPPARAAPLSDTCAPTLLLKVRRSSYVSNALPVKAGSWIKVPCDPLKSTYY